MCIPCCFKTWDKPSQIKRRERCRQVEKTDEREEDERKDEDKVEEVKISKQDVDDYIKGPDKFP